MKQVSEILKNKSKENDNNDNRNNVVNDTTVINVNNVVKNKYALDRSKFTPNTEESQLAETIAIHFNDLQNFACYYHIVKKIGCDNAYRLFVTVKDAIQAKSGTKTPVRNPAKYFVWRYRRKLY